MKLKIWEILALYNTEGGDGGAGGGGGAAVLEDDKGGAGGGGDGGAGGGAGDQTHAVGMEAFRDAALNGLDEGYHEEWKQSSSRLQTPSDMAKSYLESQRHARSAITVPGDDAKPEAWDAIFDKLGRPKDPSEYQFRDTFGEGEDTYAVTDEDKAFRDSFRPVAHRAGLTQKQVGILEAWQQETNGITVDATIAKAEDITSRDLKVMKEHYGPDYDAQKQNHLTAAKHYSGDSWDALTGMQLSDGTFLLDNPIIFGMFSKIGAERTEDFRNPNGFNESGRADAQTEYDRIRNEAIGKGLLPTNPQWPTAELQQLSDKIHGTAPVQHGRSVSN